MKKRLLYYEIKNYLRHKNALLIVGMRQVGKTTLMRQLFEELRSSKKLWFDFDNPLEYKLFEDIDYQNIYKRLINLAGVNKNRLYIFIDEIQNFPEITKIIKYHIDHYNVKFVLSGSSNFYLKNLFPESLSGRKFLFHLSPASFGEFLYLKNQLSLNMALNKSTIEEKLAQNSLFIHKKFESYYDEFMSFGSLPEVIVTADKKTKKMVLTNIVASFFEKDIKLLSDYVDIRQVRDLLLLLVPRVGSMLDITKLSSELSIDRPKLYRYLELLQGVFMLHLVPKFSKSIDRAVAGGKKVYFTDTGILNTLGTVNDGQLFENTVVNQLSPYGKIAYYNKRNTAEIDAIVDKKHAFEIKLRGSLRDFKKLEKLGNKIGLDKWRVISKQYVDDKHIISPTVLL